MSYGVNRSLKRSKPRRAKRPSSRGPARSAGRSKSPARKRKSASRAPRTAKRPARKRTKAPKKRAARKYARYNPETGARVTVTADDPRFDEWPNRKPSKRAKTQAKIKADPVGYVGKKVHQRIERQAEAAAARVARSVAPGATAAVGTFVRSVAAPATALGAGLALAIVLGQHLRDLARTATGDRINKISLQFVASQKQLMQRVGARSWQEVPADARNQLLRDYKQAVSTAAAQGGFTRSVEGYK